MIGAPPKEPVDITIGYLGNMPITKSELEHNPTMIQDPEFLRVPEPENTNEWECVYCDGVNPPDKYECVHCGAPKKKQDKAPSRYVDDDSTMSEIME